MKYTRTTEHDRRIKRGDDFAGDAWLNNETGQIEYGAVGYDRNKLEADLEEFAEAYSNGDEAAQWEILGMGLGMLTADMDANVHSQGGTTVTTDKNELLCACHGLRGPGVMCGYVAGGGKRCKAPEDFDCEHKEKEDAKETDLSFSVITGDYLAGS